MHKFHLINLTALNFFHSPHCNSEQKIDVLGFLTLYIVIKLDFYYN